MPTLYSLKAMGRFFSLYHEKKEKSQTVYFEKLSAAMIVRNWVIAFMTTSLKKLSQLFHKKKIL
jgi:hypothetical protein